MPIGEAITLLKFNNKHIADLKNDDLQQIAEWLELLKWYEQGMKDIPCESGVLPKDIYSAGYIKGIDDFAEKLKSECREHYVDCDPYFGGIIESILYEDDIDELAEQLKEKNKL